MTSSNGQTQRLGCKTGKRLGGLGLGFVVVDIHRSGVSATTGPAYTLGPRKP